MIHVWEEGGISSRIREEVEGSVAIHLGGHGYADRRPRANGKYDNCGDGEWIMTVR